MSFKPQGSKDFAPRTSNEPKYNFPIPSDGNQDARISLIVDLGEQNREDGENEDGTTYSRKPCQQVAVFADLVDEVVDYGGDIGEAQYRLMLNKNFKGDVQGINFTAVPPKDAQGNTIKGKIWSFHPANLLSKLAKATGNDVILGGNYEDNMNVEKLLGSPLMINVEVKQTESDKKGDDGNPIVYTNVRAAGYSPIPKKKGVQLEVSELTAEPKCITFDNATVEDVKVLRYAIRKKIKLANNYAGSQMQRAIEEYEASLESGGSAAAKPQASKPKAPVKPKQPEPESEEDFDDESAPF